MENTNEKRLYQVAEIQLTYKSNVKPSLRPKINCSKDAYNVLLENWDGSQIEFLEQFKVMLLNRANNNLMAFFIFRDHKCAQITSRRFRTDRPDASNIWKYLIQFQRV